MTYERSSIFKWIDGDTVDVLIDLGFYVKTTVRVRLESINTPEKGQPGYKEACDFVNLNYPINTPIKTVCHGKDRYGRWIATLLTEGSDKSINQTLLDNKLATPYLE